MLESPTNKLDQNGQLGYKQAAGVVPGPAPAKPGSSLKESREHARYDELEAFRGFAALGIVIFHAYQHSRVGQTYVFENTPFHLLFRHLDAGVAWFFVLSGFLIFLPFARAALHQQGAASVRGYLIRRIFRILPLYYIAILVVWSVRFGGGSEQWFDLARHLTFTQIFESQHIFWTIGPAWSLAVEMIFYLVMAVIGPLVYTVCGCLATPQTRVLSLALFLVGLAGVSLGYKGWAFYIAHVPEEDYAVYFSFVSKLDTFVFGMLLALVVAIIPKSFKLPGSLALGLRLGGFGLMVFTFALRETNTFIWLYFHTLCGLAFLMILVSTVLSQKKTLWTKFLRLPVLQFVGLISYSLYMWHEPILIDLSDRFSVSFEAPNLFILSTALFVGIAIIAASLSYWGLERPATFLQRFFTRQGGMVERYPDQQKQLKSL